MKFLHAADIHLDSPLGRAAWHGPTCRPRWSGTHPPRLRRHDRPGARGGRGLRCHRRRPLRRRLEGFLEGLFFAGEMQRLGRPCFLLRGNHDARSFITRRSEAAATMCGNSRPAPAKHSSSLISVSHCTGTRSRTGRCRRISRPSYRDRVAGMVNIGVLHTSADDPGEHESYAPCQHRVADAEGLRLLGAWPYPCPAGAVRAALGGLPRQHAGTPPEGEWRKGLHIGHG